MEDMFVETKHFGRIDLDEDKIIYFEHGILGFEDLKNYTILYDNSEGERPDVSWLQSLDEPGLAIPLVDPFIVMEDYNPYVEDELLKTLGDVSEDSMVIFVSMTVPSNVEDASVNLKAPFLINVDTKRGCQIIAENQDYEVKHRFYEILKARKASKGGAVC